MSKILIVGPAWVGDMVMAQSLFKLLKQNNPNDTIDVLAPAWSLPLLARMPEVSQAFVMPFAHGQLCLQARFQLGKKLREQHYDQAIVLPNSFKSALIPFFAKIPQRTGWHREMRGLFLLNDARWLNKTRYPLMIERFLALGLPANHSLPAPYPIPELQISTTTLEQTGAKYQLEKKAPIMILCPGAEFGPAKRWPEQYYAEVAKQKIQAGWHVWIMGSPKDQSVAERIMTLTENKCIDLTGRTTLEEAVDIMSLASLVVSNDSGLMHIAAALKKPLVVIYGPTSAAFTPPLHDQAKILSSTLSCQPCFQRECPLQHQRCMRDLLPATVLTAITELNVTCVS